jgi:hypothetical protein
MRKPIAAAIHRCNMLLTDVMKSAQRSPEGFIRPRYPSWEGFPRVTTKAATSRRFCSQIYEFWTCPASHMPVI